MTRFVELDGKNGRHVWFNIDKIVSFGEVDGYTHVYCVDDGASGDRGLYIVRQTPEDILRLIRNAQNEVVEKLVIHIDNPVTDANIDEAIKKIREAQEKLLGA